jgi:hypothetical protein
MQISRMLAGKMRLKMQHPSSDFVKIFFKLDSTEWHRSAIESLWARPVAGFDIQNSFQLENSPFYFRGVSYLDIVEGFRANDGGLEFARVLQRSGHSTYQLLVPAGSRIFPKFWAPLEARGCSYESGTMDSRVLYSVDVPPGADIHSVYKELEAGEAAGAWIFQEGHVGHAV